MFDELSMPYFGNHFLEVFIYFKVLPCESESFGELLLICFLVFNILAKEENKSALLFYVFTFWGL